MVEKGFKQTEIGLIPEDWEVKKLGEVADVVRGGSPRPIESYITKDVNGINWIKIGDVDKSAKYIYSTEEKIISKGAAYSRLVNEGDFLLSNSMSFGRPYILKTSGCVHDGWLVIQNYQETFETNFLYYILGFKTTLNQYKNLAAGSTVLNLNKEIVKKVYVSYPKFQEQILIAQILSETDTLIEKLEQLIAKKRLIKQGAMQQLLKPKEGWEVKKLGEVVEIKKGQLITEKTAIPDGIPVIGGGMTITYFHNKPNRTGVTITISASGAYAGYVSIHNKSIFASDCSTISEGEKYDIYFLYFCLLNKQREIYGLQTGGGQPHVYPQQLRDLFIAIPKSKSEQTRIAQILTDMDNEIEALERQLAKYKQIKQGMMQVLLTGKIRLVKPVRARHTLSHQHAEKNG
jgi:type I restriction enzyme S subunit